MSLPLPPPMPAAFAPPAYAEDILIEKAEATYAVPKAGDVFDFNAITVPNGANYMAKILGVIYLDGQNQVISVKSGDVADAGVTYLNIAAPENAESIIGIEAYPTSFFVDSTGKVLTDPVVGAMPAEYPVVLDEALELAG